LADLLLGSDVFIDHLRAGIRVPIGRDDSAAYSVITRAELFAGRNSDDQLVSRLLSTFREIEVDRPISERAGRIRRETGIRLPDAIIAATAIEGKLQLVTRNLRDFQGVPELLLA
jgi:predicted nucleic acid-binding protein